MRNPRQVIPNMTNDNTTTNIEEILIAQNTRLNVANGEINVKIIYVTKITQGA